MIAFDEKDGAVIFAVRVIPRSSKSEIVGEHDGALKVKLNAPPVDGAANDELIKLLSKAFDLPKNSITIVSGQTTKCKRIQVTGLDLSSLACLLGR